MLPPALTEGTRCVRQLYLHERKDTTDHLPPGNLSVKKYLGLFPHIGRHQGAALRARAQYCQLTDKAEPKPVLFPGWAKMGESAYIPGSCS